MKKKFMAGIIVTLIIAILCIALVVIWRRRGPENTNTESPMITIGFSQVGAESDWRTANSVSIKNTFTPERGYNLIFEDARQNQSNQIMAIRSFIQQDVDYIVFSPVVQDGWDTVLEEAKRAEIPVIIIDRMIDVEDESLYTAAVGSDFYLQGRLVCAALKQYIEKNEISEVNIVNIQGTLGSTAQIARTRALEEAVERNGWNLLAQEGGEYTEARAYEVMTDMLAKYDNINFVYCENDNEAFGAIEAIKAAGKSVGPGGDIQIVSFDATSAGLRRTLTGEIIINMECNPLQGPETERIIRRLQEGIEPVKQYYLLEEIFVTGEESSEIILNGKSYYTEPVNEKLIEERQY